MDSGKWDWIVPAGSWEVARPLLPAPRVRPQCSWRALPLCFGASKSCASRFLIWSRAGMWERLHQAVNDIPCDEGTGSRWLRTLGNAAPVAVAKGSRLTVTRRRGRSEPSSAAQLSQE